MGGHGPATEWGEDHASDYKSKLGIYMFFVYVLVYAGFIAINVLSPKMMEAIVFAGLNLSIVYGVGLILLAFIMGLVYNKMCSNKEDELNT